MAPNRFHHQNQRRRSRRRALFCCAGIALAAPTGAFHAPSPIAPNARNMCTPSAAAALCTFKTSTLRPPLPSARAADCRGATSHVGYGASVSELGAGGGGEELFYTPADLDAYSAPWGITLHYRGTLNSYRIEAHRPNGEVAGYTTGFYLGELLHLDKVQVWCSHLPICYYTIFVACQRRSTKTVCMFVHSRIQSSAVQQLLQYHVV